MARFVYAARLMDTLRQRAERQLRDRLGWLEGVGERIVARPLHELLAVTALALAAVSLFALRTSLMTRGNALFAEPGWDHHAYIAMARDNPIDFHLAPFSWRVGLPTVAKALPFGLQASFFLLAFVALTATVVVLYYSIRAAGFSRQYALLSVGFLLSLGWAVKFALQDFWLPDGLVFLAVTGALLCILQKRVAAFAVVVLLGVLVKEAVVFVVPLYYTLQAKRVVDARLAIRTVAVALPAVAALLALRLAIPTRNEDLAYVATLTPQLQTFRDFIPSYDYYALLRDIGYHQRLHDYRLETWLLYTSGTWGVPILTLAVIGAMRKPLLALRLSPFLALVYAQILFALNIERLLVVGFPAMIWLALEGVRHLGDRIGVAAAWFLPLPLLLFVLQFEHPATIPVRFEAETAVFLGWLAVVVALAPLRVARE